MFSEFVATFGLLAVIWGCSRRRADATPFAVGAYITAVPGFIVGQLAGAAVATLLFRWLIPAFPSTPDKIIVSRARESV
jgi:glycerol uptake facilitator-like aquaporin